MIILMARHRLFIDSWEIETYVFHIFSLFFDLSTLICPLFAVM